MGPTVNHGVFDIPYLSNLFDHVRDSQSQDYCIPIYNPFEKKSNLINKHEHVDLLLSRFIVKIEFFL